MAKKIQDDVTAEMSVQELKEKIHSLKKEQMNLRFQLNQGQGVNTARIRQVRRQVARANTFLQHKNLSK